MSAAGYAALNTASLGVSGVVSYFGWGLITGPHPPHRWVVIMYALAADAAIGAAFCGGWNAIRAIRAARAQRRGETLHYFAESAGRDLRYKQRIRRLARQQPEDAIRTAQEPQLTVEGLQEAIAFLENELEEVKKEVPPPVSLARSMTALVLTVLAVVFTTAGSILGAGIIA